MNTNLRRAMGCGCGSLLVMAIAVIVVGVALLSGSQRLPLGGRSGEPIPENVPPLAGEPVPAINIDAPGRTSLQLRDWAEPIAADTGMSAQAVQAYGNAALIAQQAWPECHLAWTTLAGIGYVETRHGTYSGKLFSGSELDENGVATPPIVGIPLDGSEGVAHIPDTDGGRLDGDGQFDRAVGPMQFIPGSWARYGRDANGDGVADPNQIDDAALSAAHLLCQGRDLADPEQWVAAVHAYNQSVEYMVNVRDAANAYGTRQRP